MRYEYVLKHISLLILCILAGNKAMAQYDVAFSHYFRMEPSFNPAAVGKESKLNVTAAYALDMAGFEHNPRTMYAAADMPFYFLNTHHGAGVQFMNDKIGLFTHQKLALQYACKLRLLGGTVSVGMQAGVLNENFDGSGLNINDPNDPAFATAEVKGNGLDLGVGVYYMRDAWYVGASVQHLNSPLIELGTRNELKIDAAYYLTGGYNIKLRNPFLTVKSSFLVRTDGVAYRADVGGRLVYAYEKKMMYGGISYSPTNSVTFLVGGNFHGIVVGYSYELYTSALAPGNGSHELCVSYLLDMNLAKRGKNKHKSVRIL